MRDVMNDPRVGDQIQGIWHKPAIHVGPCSIITVEAIVGNLLGLSDGQQIFWVTRADWPPSDDYWIRSYRVVTRVEE